MTAPRGARQAMIRQLDRSPDPSIRWRIRVRVRGEPRTRATLRALEREIRTSARVERLLTRGRKPFVAGKFGGVYRNWQGIHWALTALADIGYPDGDEALRPLLDRALGMWTQPGYDRVVPATAETIGAIHDGVPRLNGRFRRCASQQGNALLYASRLARGRDPAAHLADLLARWQWDDGGWNCSRSPTAHVSSFMETLTPMRGLAAFAAVSGSSKALATARRAAGVFLERSLFRRRKNGAVMRPQFLQLHYPLYWHYDVLGGLKGIAEVGLVEDPRCSEALDWLEERELPRGGWAADARYYHVSEAYDFGAEYVDWGEPAHRRSNEWVTTDALYVLREAGRLGD